MEGWEGVKYALLGTLFTWGVTALGSAVVFLPSFLPLTFTQEQKLLDWSLGFAGGVMLAASYWSLLAPAIERAEEDPMYGPDGRFAWVPATMGFLAGGVAMQILQAYMPDATPTTEDAKGTAKSWKRILLLIIAITVHNFPEGMAVGVAFGAAKDATSFQQAVLLTIGIGLQNFPEGLAVSMPLRREGLPLLRSFWYGQLSGVVEPIGGVLGAALVIVATPILPYALAFAAGCMVFVVCDELLPEAHRGGNGRLSTTGCLVGFAVMMAMDVGLG